MSFCFVLGRSLFKSSPKVSDWKLILIFVISRDKDFGEKWESREVKSSDMELKYLKGLKERS